MQDAGPPRYRIEHRHPGLAPLIVGFAPTFNGAHLVAAAKRRVLRSNGTDGALVIVDQRSEADLKAFPVAASGRV